MIHHSCTCFHQLILTFNINLLPLIMLMAVKTVSAREITLGECATVC